MISEKEFASGFAGFWAEHLPFLSPNAVAQINVTGKPLMEGRRDWVKPMEHSSGAGSNDLVAETAFELFAASVSTGREVLRLAQDKQLIRDVASNALGRIMGLRGYWLEKRENLETPTEEAIELAKRLEYYFGKREKERPISMQPRFKGCGILSSCYGDILTPGNLYELKMVDRNLRSIDLKQVLTYCSLNYHSHQYGIQHVIILNPRRGIEYRFVLEDLIGRLSGRTSAEFFHQVTDFLCSFEMQHQGS